MRGFCLTAWLACVLNQEFFVEMLKEELHQLVKEALPCSLWVVCVLQLFTQGVHVFVDCGYRDNISSFTVSRNARALSFSEAISFLVFKNHLGLGSVYLPRVTAAYRRKCTLLSGWSPRIRCSEQKLISHR